MCVYRYILHQQHARICVDIVYIFLINGVITTAGDKRVISFLHVPNFFGQNQNTVFTLSLIHIYT